MGIDVGTIFKWHNPDNEYEMCEDGQCIGKVTKLTTMQFSGKPAVIVKYWELCPKHEKIDPDGTGPYELEFIWQIGQI